MTRDEVLELIRAHLSAELEVEASAIGAGTRFKEDLEADSLDLVELVMELEDRYGIRIPDEEAAKILTVGQAADFVAAAGSRERVELRPEGGRFLIHSDRLTPWKRCGPYSTSCRRSSRGRPSPTRPGFATGATRTSGSPSWGTWS